MGNSNFASMSQTSVFEVQDNMECGLPDLATGWESRTVLEDNLGEGFAGVRFCNRSYRNEANLTGSGCGMKNMSQ